LTTAPGNYPLELKIDEEVVSIADPPLCVGNLLSAENASFEGGTTGTVWNGAAVGSSNAIQTTFTLAEGDWGVVLRVWDRGGRRREFPLTLVGSSTPVTVQVHAASPAAVWNPVASPRGGDVFAAPTVTLTCSTSGASIEYQVVALGAPAGGSWTAYSAPASVAVDSTLYARAKKVGLTDSPVIRQDYAYLDPETV
jgi:hypothetical protein